MISLPFKQINKVLCLGAHADDIEIGCGGTLLTLIKENPDVEICWVVLSGSQQRETEARNSAQAFLQNVRKKEIHVKAFRDAHFPYEHAADLKAYLANLAGQVSPDLIFTHRREDRHQDHRLVADLTWQHFRNHWVWEYEIPKYEGDLGQPNLFVALTEDDCQRKARKIIREFPSQLEKPWFSTETLLALMRIRGVECQAPSGYAEGFYCRKIRFGDSGREAHTV